jgi:hypothetical protein
MQTPPPPKIEKLYTSIPEKDGWISVPEGTKEITFYVEAHNTDTVLFWLMSTGTLTRPFASSSIRIAICLL